MKAATIRELRQELNLQDEEKLVDLCLHLARFKKDNKELLTYLLFEAQNEENYIDEIKEEVEEMFTQTSTLSFYHKKKGIRKILRLVKKYIRYSKKKETEVQLLIHFCGELKSMYPGFSRSVVLLNLYKRQIQVIEKALSYLHEDLQYDYRQELEELFS